MGSGNYRAVATRKGQQGGGGDSKSYYRVEEWSGSMDGDGMKGEKK